MAKSAKDVRKREGENGAEEVERLQTCAPPHEGILLRPERGRGEREKARVHKQRKWEVEEEE